MKFEHFAINVSEPAAMAAWYCEHLGMSVRMSSDQPPYMHFLADSTGRVVIELYCNENAPVPDYAGQSMFQFHVAFESTDAAGEAARLQEAGGTLENDDTLADGSRILVVRDPWGLPVQVCQRAKPFG